MLNIVLLIPNTAETFEPQGVMKLFEHHVSTLNKKTLTFTQSPAPPKHLKSVVQGWDISVIIVLLILMGLTHLHLVLTCPAWLIRSSVGLKGPQSVGEGPKSV